MISSYYIKNNIYLDISNHISYNIPILSPADSLLGSGSDEEEEDESRAANNSSSPAHAPHPALHSDLSHNGDAKPHDDSEDQVGR